MHWRVYEEFGRIVSDRGQGGTVLEVGAIPSDESLLCMAALKGAKERIGINLSGPHEYKGCKIVKGNSNRMTCFDNDMFDIVLCNALIEHDKYFWKTIDEIKRVTKPGGLVVIGAPGFTRLKAERIKSYLKKTPIIRYLNSTEHLSLFTRATITFEIHAAPGDYYRFSPQAFKEVLFDGMDAVEVRTIMLPPRIIGAGIKAVPLS